MRGVGVMVNGGELKISCWCGGGISIRWVVVGFL